jgi:glycosidase
VQYVDGRVDIAFEFDLAGAMLTSAGQHRSRDVYETMQTVLEAYPTGQYAPFLTNHDQDRVMSVLQEDEGAARVAATMLLTAPGVPFVYYGEEIGMVGAGEHERIRTPMQWEDGETAGFTTGTPWEPLQSGVDSYNVALQDGDPDSLLNHYRSLVALRNAHPALRRGTTYLVASDSGAVFALLRHTDEEAILVVVNLATSDTDDYALTLPEGPLTAVSDGVLLMGEGDLGMPTVNAAGGFEGYTPVPSLPPQSSAVIRLVP